MRELEDAIRHPPKVVLMVFESLTLKLNLTLNLTSAISKYFSEDDFRRDLPLVDVGLRSPGRKSDVPELSEGVSVDSMIY